MFAPYGCRWAFEGNGSWITVGPEDSRPSPWGDRNGTVVAVVAANTSVGLRTGSATIAGRTFGVTQDGQAAAACTYAISPAVHSARALGGAGSVSINISAGCSWRIEAEPGPVAWIAINSGQRGAGPATIPYSIEPNQSLSSRTATIVVHGDSGNARLVQTVTQAGGTCLYAVSPSSSNWSAGGGRAGEVVSAEPASCAWRTSTNEAWITIDPGASATGHARQRDPECVTSGLQARSTACVRPFTPGLETPVPGPGGIAGERASRRGGTSRPRACRRSPCSR